MGDAVPEAQEKSGTFTMTGIIRSVSMGLWHAGRSHLQVF